MLIDHRTYTLRPGTLNKHLENYEREAFEVETRHYGPPLGWLVAATPPQPTEDNDGYLSARYRWPEARRRLGHSVRV
jgi:hypothetical protein